jgi:PIN domain nuclease of toxin-antitoxin system
VGELPEGGTGLSAVVADTHALIWFLMEPARLSPPAGAALQAAADSGIHFSAITIVEIVYLIEKGRLPSAVLERVMAGLGTPGSTLRVAPLDLEIAGASPGSRARRCPTCPTASWRPPLWDSASR